jgi:hypothetical protein
MSTAFVTQRFPRPRPLSKRDLDREIERLVEDVSLGCVHGADQPNVGNLRPRWIRPSELVRRVLPFTSRN